ncbi:hypothetical protein D1AOALGA4SA_12084 [Olavius algarvensis Delta 1 endosymbiont]|nr:hypothetical protein D1AOALGA4SA_12084 [Olavius algarvensis Delta 1 endosymbiont]
MPRNGWTESIGMGGRLRPELPAGITRNTQLWGFDLLKWYKAL